MADELELMHKEKLHLVEIGNNHVVSLFNDIKILGGLGLALVTLAPIFQKIDGNKDLSLILFIIFLALNIIITFIWLINLSKQLQVNYYFDEVQTLEEEIRKKLENKNTETSHIVDNWKSNAMHIQMKLSVVFSSLMSLVTISFPTIFLLQYCENDDSCFYYALIYFVSALLLSAFSLYAVQVVYGKKHNKETYKASRDI